MRKLEKHFCKKQEARTAFQVEHTDAEDCVWPLNNPIRLCENVETTLAPVPDFHDYKVWITMQRAVQG